MRALIRYILPLLLTAFTANSCVAWPSLIAALGGLGGEKDSGLLFLPLGGGGGGGGDTGGPEPGQGTGTVPTAVVTDIEVDTDVPDGNYAAGNVI